MVTFNVIGRLPPNTLLGCDCEEHVEAIKPRKQIVELDYKSTVSILRNGEGGSRDDFPLSEYQQLNM